MVSILEKINDFGASTALLCFILILLVIVNFDDLIKKVKKTLGLVDIDEIKEKEFIEKLEELEKKIDDILEQSYGNKKMKLKKKSEMQDGDINAMPTKYVDVTFSGGMCKRYYCLEWRGYLIDIEISGKGNSFHKEFKKILNSFTFTPEMM